MSDVVTHIILDCVFKSMLLVLIRGLFQARNYVTDAYKRTIELLEEKRGDVEMVRLRVTNSKLQIVYFSLMNTYPLLYLIVSGQILSLHSVLRQIFRPVTLSRVLISLALLVADLPCFRLPKSC